MSMETDIRAKNNEKAIQNLEERVGTLESSNGHKEEEAAEDPIATTQEQTPEMKNLVSVTKAQAQAIADLRTELATQKAYIKGLEGKSNPTSLRPPTKGRGRGMGKK